MLKKFLFLTIVLNLCILNKIYADAVVSQTDGSLQYQKEGAWVPLSEGDGVKGNSVILRNDGVGSASKIEIQPGVDISLTDSSLVTVDGLNSETPKVQMDAGNTMIEVYQGSSPVTFQYGDYSFQISSGQAAFDLSPATGEVKVATGFVSGSVQNGINPANGLEPNKIYTFTPDGLTDVQDITNDASFAELGLKPYYKGTASVYESKIQPNITQKKSSINPNEGYFEYGVFFSSTDEFKHKYGAMNSVVFGYTYTGNHIEIALRIPFLINLVPEMDGLLDPVFFDNWNFGIDLGGTTNTDYLDIVDTVHDVLGIIDNITVTSTDERTYLNIGDVTDVTYGTGLLVNHFSNNYNSIYTQPLGVQFRQDGPVMYLDAFSADAVNRMEMGGRLGFRFFELYDGGGYYQDHFEIGVNLMTDLSSNLYYQTLDTYQNFAFSSRTTFGLSADARIPIYGNDDFGIDVLFEYAILFQEYSENDIMNSLGSGMSFGGEVFFYGAYIKAYGTYNPGYFMPSFFGEAYEWRKAYIYENTDEKLESTTGVKAEAGYEGEQAGFRVSYLAQFMEDYKVYYDEFSFSLYTTQALSEIFTMELGVFVYDMNRILHYGSDFYDNINYNVEFVFYPSEKDEISLIMNRSFFPEKTTRMDYTDLVGIKYKRWF